MQQQRARPDAANSASRLPGRSANCRAIAPVFDRAIPADAAARQAICRQKAAAWLDGIKVESGILVELGLDEAGKPVISFSHLTFQEYLAASALKEQPDLPPVLLEQLAQTSLGGE